MSQLVEDFGNYLIDNSIGSAIGTDVFTDYEPDSPDVIIAIIEYGGGRAQVNVESMDRRLQVRVRGTNTSARATIHAIYNLIISDMKTEDGIVYLDDPPVRFAIMTPMDTPSKLKVDEKGRVIYTFNLEITTTQDN